MFICCCSFLLSNCFNQKYLASNCPKFSEDLCKNRSAYRWISRVNFLWNWSLSWNLWRSSYNPWWIETNILFKNQIKCVVFKLPWSLRKCVCSKGTKTSTLCSLFNLPPFCQLVGLGMQCNTWTLGDYLRCSPGPCLDILNRTKSCTQCTRSKIHFPVFCMNKRHRELTSF